MLINCPRCHFSQPKDQYCAQCGVDMEAFKPKERPLLEKIFKSTATHIVILLLAAVVIGQTIIRREEPQRWVQKLTPFQGVSKTQARFEETSTGGEERSRVQSDDATEALNSLRDQEISITTSVEQPIQVGTAPAAAAPPANLGAKLAATTSSPTSTPESAQPTSTTPTFRIIYAEVPSETVGRWISESSGAGLYQNLQDYSAGLLPDFRRKMDGNVQILKESEKKLAMGQADTNFSGALSDEGSQMIGLATTIEYKSFENGNIHGTIVVNRSGRQGRDNFPAEFDLPRNAVFFMLGVLKRQSLVPDRPGLNMPPFQIFKSADFMTQKTEFVIIVEPEYK